MSTWIIGDLQGCGKSFSALRDNIAFQQEKDTLILVGDIVNRGPTSLETLRWVVEHQHCVQTVLGNHDIHLLWCALGNGQPRGRDTLDEILEAPDRHELIEWLRQQPLILNLPQAVVVHAGLHPTWSLAHAYKWAQHIHAMLTGDEAGDFLDRMRADAPQNDHEQRVMDALDVLTRMRALNRNDLRPNFGYNGTLNKVPSELVAWFLVPAQHARPPHVFFGHWAALGFHTYGPYVGLDSGCVWGNGLTAWCLEDGRQVFQPAVD